MVKHKILLNTRPFANAFTNSHRSYGCIKKVTITNFVVFQRVIIRDLKKKFGSIPFNPYIACNS